MENKVTIWKTTGFSGLFYTDFASKSQKKIRFFTMGRSGYLKHEFFF